jgi:hypothetical protein
MDDIREQFNKIIETAARHATGPEPAELRRRLRHRRQRRAAATVALLLGVGIALPAVRASLATPPGTGRGPTPPVPAARGDASKPPAVKQLTCGDVVFPVTALSAPPGAERGRNPAARALVAFLASDAGKDPFRLPKTGWKQLTRDDNRALYGLGTPGTVTFAVLIQRHGTRWQWERYGGCRPQVVVPGFETTAWELAGPRVGKQASRLPAATRVVPVEFVTNGCSSTFDHAEVVTTAEAVTITVYLRPVKRPPGIGCAGSGLPVRRDVALPEPLGRRALLDGSTVPAAVVQPAIAHP